MVGRGCQHRYFSVGMFVDRLVVFVMPVLLHGPMVVVVAPVPWPIAVVVAVTRAITQAGKLLDIEVLDHLVIGNSGFVSMKERGLGFA